MKKLIILLIVALSFSACGEKKAKAEGTESKPISLEIDGIYEKDDSLVVYYQVRDVMLYDKPVTKIVKGSATAQKIIIDMPANVPVENFSVITSTNKEQDHITITSISVRKGNTFIDGANYKFIENFMTDESFKWDQANSRYILSHSNKYPPAMVGSKNLLALMKK